MVGVSSSGASGAGGAGGGGGGGGESVFKEERLWQSEMGCFIFLVFNPLVKLKRRKSTGFCLT
jgi:hypothetical protein